jgi:hypothetical protein
MSGYTFYAISNAGYAEWLSWQRWLIMFYMLVCWLCWLRWQALHFLYGGWLVMLPMLAVLLFSGPACKIVCLCLFAHSAGYNGCQAVLAV